MCGRVQCVERCLECDREMPERVECEDGWTTGPICAACEARLEAEAPEPYVVRCGDCGSVYSYERGCCTGCGRS
jgi:hypothetical protein